ncbi:MAG: DUF1841 family protein [Nitrospiria bacterium]
MLFDRDNQWRFTTIAKKRLTGVELEGEEALIAHAMNLHPELDPLWDLGEASATPQEVNGTVVNPFIHTALHVLVEKQLEEKSPPEALTALDVLLARGVDRHEAVHAIAALYADLYFTTFRRGQSFEETSYIELLKQLASPED